MGKAIYFKGANVDLGAPQGMTAEQVYTCPVMVGIDTQLNSLSCITCFQLDSTELEELKVNGGKVYLQIIGWQPTVCVSAHNLTTQLRLMTEEERIAKRVPKLDKYQEEDDK
jgi:hypothetical protein